MYRENLEKKKKNREKKREKMNFKDKKNTNVKDI